MYTRTKRVRVCVCVCVSSLPTNRRSCWAAHLNGRGAPTGDEPDSLFLFIYPVHFFEIRKKKRKPVELELELFPHFLLSRLFDYHRNPFPVGIYIPSKKKNFYQTISGLRNLISFFLLLSSAWFRPFSCLTSPFRAFFFDSFLSTVPLGWMPERSLDYPPREKSRKEPNNKNGMNPDTTPRHGRPVFWQKEEEEEEKFYFIIYRECRRRWCGTGRRVPSQS
jgi:hypothetical protein